MTVTDLPATSATQIPNTETDSSPEVFREGPAAAISAAVNASQTVKLVLNGAQVALAARADKYTQDVGVKAVEFAGERRASAVDVPDVAKAADTLYPPQQQDSGSPWKWGVLGIIGGAVISFLITLLTPNIGAEWIPLAIIIGIVVFLACIVWGVKIAWPRKTR